MRAIFYEYDRVMAGQSRTEQSTLYNQRQEPWRRAVQRVGDAGEGKGGNRE